MPPNTGGRYLHAYLERYPHTKNIPIDETAYLQDPYHYARHGANLPSDACPRLHVCPPQSHRRQDGRQLG